MNTEDLLVVHYISASKSAELLLKPRQSSHHYYITLSLIIQALSAVQNPAQCNVSLFLFIFYFLYFLFLMLILNVY